MTGESGFIRIRDFVYIILHYWKRIVLIGIGVFAIIAGIFMFSQYQKRKIDFTNEEQRLKYYEDITSDADKEKAKNAYTTYSSNKKQYDNVLNKKSKSAIYKIKDTATPVYSVQYLVSGIEDDEVNTMIALYQNKLIDNDTEEKIQKLFSNTEYDTSFISVQRIADSSIGNPCTGLFETVIIASNENICKKISGIIETRIDALNLMASSVYTGISVKQISTNFNVEYNADVAEYRKKMLDEQKQYKAAMDKAVNDLSDAAQDYYYVVYQNGTDVEYPDFKNQPIITKKKLAISILTAMVVGIGGVICICIVSGTLRSADDLTDSFQLYLFGTVTEKKHRRKLFRNKNKKKRNEKSEAGSLNRHISRISNEIVAYCKEKNYSRIVFTGTYIDNSVKDVLLKMAEILSGQQITVIAMGSILEDNVKFDNLMSSDGIVVFEKQFSSKYRKIDKELQICTRLNRPVIGCVLMNEIK